MKKTKIKPAIKTAIKTDTWDDVLEDLKDHIETLDDVDEIDDPETIIKEWFRDNYHPPTKKGAPAPENPSTPARNGGSNKQRDSVDRY